MDDEEGLIYPAVQFPKLVCLIVTGNPFAIGGDPFATSMIENLMLRRPGGRVINETMNQATYLRRQKTNRHDQ